MGKLVKKNFSCTNDFERVNDFLSKTYEYNGIYNWDNARWSFNRYCVHNKQELSGKRNWEASVQIWEDSQGEIVALAHIEEPGDYFFQVHPDYKYLEEEMLIWAIDDCHKRYTNLNRIVVMNSVNDTQRKKLYGKYDAMLIGNDIHRIIELKKKCILPKLPEGYKIINIDGKTSEMYKKVSDLYTYKWPTSTYIPNGETVAAMNTSVAYKENLSFIIVDDKEQYVAFTIAWVDSLNKIAHFYPVTVLQEYLHTNILEVMLINALDTLISLGFEKATISAWYDQVENEVFEKLGFVKADVEEIYEIKI